MSSVFKIYSPEDCDFYYDGELQGHIEGNSDRAFRFEVERKGAYRLKFVNSEYKSELIVKVSIDADEEREVELDFSEVNEPVIRRITTAIEHDYETGEYLPEEVISVISKNGVIPKGIRKIGNKAFLCCSRLTSITIPNSVTEIGIEAFSHCSSLTSITIPNSVNEIGRDAFSHCRRLTSITIPDSVTKIGYGAFQGCSGLTSITIPNSVTEIGREAFSHCSSLTSITIPNNVTVIGMFAFSDCRRLTSITIPDSVTKIGYGAFYCCSRLTSITIPNSVTVIGDSAFNQCYSLTSITIPNNVTVIGMFAFSDCSSLTSITIPNSVTLIGSGAFSKCSGLTAFYGKYASDDNRCLIKDGELVAFAPKDITKYTIPNGVNEIGTGAFSKCGGLTAFYGKYASDDNRCLIKDGKLVAFAPKDITKYTIPNGVNEIGIETFSGCSSLTSITIPDSVTKIKSFAFRNCSSLTSIYCKATIPPKSNANIYDSISEPSKIYVPKSGGSTVLEAYKSAEGWKSYADIIEEYDFDNE